MMDIATPNTARISGRIWNAAVVGAGHDEFVIAFCLARTGLRQVVAKNDCVGGVAIDRELCPGFAQLSPVTQSNLGFGDVRIDNTSRRRGHGFARAQSARRKPAQLCQHGPQHSLNARCLFRPSMPG
jgi:hypothetical protein